jgi:hypothetical protein
MAHIQTYPRGTHLVFPIVAASHLRGSGHWNRSYRADHAYSRLLPDIGTLKPIDTIFLAGLCRSKA